MEYRSVQNTEPNITSRTEVAKVPFLRTRINCPGPCLSMSASSVHTPFSVPQQRYRITLSGLRHPAVTRPVAWPAKKFCRNSCCTYPELFRRCLKMVSSGKYIPELNDL